MKLRIVSGTLRGRYLTIPERDSVFRPTRERVRESVAAILAPQLQHAVVADICAGSGGMGFEMISRGASRVIFVEADRFRCKLLREHAQRFGVDEQCQVAEQEVTVFAAKCTEQFDVIYFDPPYDAEWGEPALPLLLRLLGDKGLLVYERRSSKEHGAAEGQAGMLQPSDIRVYGETEICFYNKSS